MKTRQIARQISLCGFSSAIFMMTGCASIVGGTQQTVSVRTQSANGQMISGASCKLQNAKGTWYTTTPGSLVVHRAYGDLSISCRRSGEQFGSTTAISSARGWMWGNILFGGFIGAGVDIGTGAGFDYPVGITVAAGENAVPASPFVAEASPAAASSHVAAHSPAMGGAQQEADHGTSELPAIQRTVTNGVSTLVAAHADWNNLCRADLAGPDVSMLDKAQHGTLEIRQGEFIAPPGDAPPACSDGKIYGTQIFYAPKPGFHGADHLRYEVATATGRFTRVVNIVVR